MRSFPFSAMSARPRRAALAAQGESEISNVQYIERGYEDIIGKLRALGADIRAIDEPDESSMPTAQIC